MQQIPSLFQLMLVEGKVNAFIHCFVGVRRITSLRDLDVEICKNEGVQRFDELELGPLLRHPLVIHYFLVPPETKEIVDITSEQIISYLVEYMDKVKHKSIKPEEFLDFIAEKRSLPVKEKLGVRIQNLRMHVTSIREARKVEESTLSKYIQSMKKTPKERNTEGKMSEQLSISLQKKNLRKRYFTISKRLKSFSPLHKESAGKHITFISSSEDEDEDEEEDDENDFEDGDVKDETALGSHTKIASQNRNISEQRVSNCPYPSVNEEKARLGLKTEMGGQSQISSDRVVSDKNKKSSAKKRKFDNRNVDNSLKLPKRDKLELSGDSVDHLQDNDCGNSELSQSELAIDGVDKAGYLSLNDDALEQFITTWKEACRIHSISEVLDKMLHFYNSTDRRRKNLKSLFKSFPCIGLLHVAVTSIKYGMWDSLYETLQGIGERECITSTSGHNKPESISIEPSKEADALPGKQHSSQVDPGVSIDDVSQKISTYFELNSPILVEGKSVLERQFIFLKNLDECQKWLTKQFSVKKFRSLGYGEFYRFLEEHPSLIPNKVLESLFGEVRKSAFEVSMLQYQLMILLSQAASCLWENESLTKDHICKLLKKQFPLISFQISGDLPLEDFSKYLKTPKNANSFSVLFSVTLLGTNKVSLLPSNLCLLENSGTKPDIGLITGALGSVSANDAIKCLLKAPMLSDLHSWTHWDLIYAPSLGPLVEWLMNKVSTKELLCLVTKDGKILRIDHSATVDEFLEALITASAFEAAVKLLSLFSLYGGERHVPLALLKCHVQRGIEIIMKNAMDQILDESKCNIYMGTAKPFKVLDALDGCTTVKQPLFNLLGKHGIRLNSEDQHKISKAVSVASRFILDCLVHLPSEFHSFAAGLLLSGLQPFIKDAPLEILRQCTQTQRRMLHEIGLSLSISEWVADYQAFSSGTADDLSVSIEVSGPQGSPMQSSHMNVKTDRLEEKLVSHDKMMIDVDSVENSEIYGEACGDKVDEVATKKVASKSILLDRQEIQDGSLIIESIRQEEFGLVSSLTDADNIILKKQHARLGRALQCLSQELYSQDSHFLLELVQNADDNLYMNNVEPTLAFVLQSSGIVVLNNEQGFTTQNIRALCDVGNSTKKGLNAGYIGQKGIGFKSVFRVTDAPEIHSNGFHVKFDISEGQIGFVLPTVVAPCDTVSLRRLLPGDQAGTCWNTCIVLPFKSKLRDGMGLSSIVSLFSDLHPSLLLFLHRLQCIKFRNILNDTYTVMKRENLEDGIVKVSHGDETMSWFVEAQSLQANVIRPDVQTTKIAVAFTLKECSDGEYKPHLEQQPVFSFLPLRTYGLKFILQGDFVLPSSREEVDSDSAWNQWLLAEFPGLFVGAQRSFCGLRSFQGKPGRAVSAYMSFVPLVGEVHGFFSQLPRMIISKLRISNCLLAEGKEEWVPPCRVLRNWNEQARILLPDKLLHEHTGLGYLDKDISLADSLAKALGVNDYGPGILIDTLSSICHGVVGMKLLGLNWLSALLSTLYVMLVHSSGQALINTWVEVDLCEMLKKTPFIPLSDGTYGSVTEGTVWLTCDADYSGSEGEHDSGPFPNLYAKLRIVSPAFLSVAALNSYGWEEITVDNVVKMLVKIGVQRLAAHELVKVHILPALSDDKTAERDTDLMTEYLSFVMVHFQSSCPHCHTERETILSELKTNAFILTNHGYKRPAELPIHFGREFGNPVDMSKFFDATESSWHVIDTIYLKKSSNNSVSFGLMKWREFFQELGVTDFVQTVQVEKNITDVSHTLLRDIMWNEDPISSDLVFKDWESPELVQLLSSLSLQNNQEKNKYLLEVLDAMWDDFYSAKVSGCFNCGSTDENKQFKSSFVQSISDVQWMASSIDRKLHYPRDLFYDCEEVRSILGNFAPYAVPQVRSRTISRDIGLKTRVTNEDALRIIEFLQSFEAPVNASIDQMSKLYAFIWHGTTFAKGEIASRFSSAPSIFVPFTKDARNMDVRSGKLFSSEEVYWHDPTGAMDLTRDMLLQSGSSSEAGCLINKTLVHVYQGLHDFFVNECKVCEIPPSRSYIQILAQLAKVSLPSQAANIVRRIFLKWANDLKAGLLEPEDVIYLKKCLLKLETAVIPTVQDKWVSLHPSFGLICWADNEELWKQFKDSDNIIFFYFGTLSIDEKEALPAKLSGLMQALGVPSLSEVITREAIFYGIEDCREKALLINWVLSYAQRYIFKLHPDRYNQLKQSGFEKICNLKVVVVQKLYYRRAVKGCDNVSNRRIECSCLLQENNLYIDQASKSHPIFMELSRLFFNETPERHLANFLHMITTMAESGSTNEQMENFIVDSQEIPTLPDEEPSWFLSSLSSHQVDDGEPQPSTDSSGIEEQNLLMFKRKPGINTNWPPADWKTAPDFSFVQETRLRTRFAALTTTDRSQNEVRSEEITCTGNQGEPVGDAVEWTIEDTPAETATDIALKNLGDREDKTLYGSSGVAFAKAASTSKESDKPSSVIIDGENKEKSHFSERDQLSFGTPNEHQATITGRTGELVAFKYFAKKVSSAGVKWVNEETETGLPYDIVIGDSEESKEYIEVKATKSAKKDWFTISTREWQFAAERGDSFSIAHILLVGPNKAKVSVYKNPVRLCQKGMLRLAILMPKSEEDIAWIA